MIYQNIKCLVWDKSVRKKYSQAYLTNANGTYKAKAALTTTWSKIEVTYAGNSVTYGVIY